MKCFWGKLIKCVQAGSSLFDDDLIMQRDYRKKNPTAQQNGNLSFLQTRIEEKGTKISEDNGRHKGCQIMVNAIIFLINR